MDSNMASPNGPGSREPSPTVSALRASIPDAHTPGPWEWDAGLIPPDGPGRYSDIYVLDEDREPIILAEFNDSLPEGRANARLIAAAPELFQIVQRVVSGWDNVNVPFTPQMPGIAIDARALLAKIGGAG